TARMKSTIATHGLNVVRCSPRIKTGSRFIQHAANIAAIRNSHAMARPPPNMGRAGTQVRPAISPRHTTTLGVSEGRAQLFDFCGHDLVLCCFLCKPKVGSLVFNWDWSWTTPPRVLPGTFLGSDRDAIFGYVEGTHSFTGKADRIEAVIVRGFND